MPLLETLANVLRAWSTRETMGLYKAKRRAVTRFTRSTVVATRRFARVFAAQVDIGNQSDSVAMQFCDIVCLRNWPLVLLGGSARDRAGRKRPKQGQRDLTGSPAPSLQPVPPFESRLGEQPSGERHRVTAKGRN